MKIQSHFSTDYLTKEHLLKITSPFKESGDIKIIKLKHSNSLSSFTSHMGDAAIDGKLLH